MSLQTAFRRETGVFLPYEACRVAKNALRPDRKPRRICYRILFAESRDCGSKVCLQSIPEFDDERMLLEHLLDDAALNTLAAPVNHSNLTESRLVRCVDVFLHHGCDVTRSKGMQVDLIFDGNAVCHRCAHYFGEGYDAVTTVLIPPRTEKSPTTVMRLGAQAATRSSRIWFVTAS